MGGHEGLQKAEKEEGLEFWLEYDGPKNQMDDELM